MLHQRLLSFTLDDDSYRVIYFFPKSYPAPVYQIYQWWKQYKINLQLAPWAKFGKKLIKMIKIKGAGNSIRYNSDLNAKRNPSTPLSLLILWKKIRFFCPTSDGFHTKGRLHLGVIWSHGLDVKSFFRRRAGQIHSAHLGKQGGFLFFSTVFIFIVLVLLKHKMYILHGEGRITEGHSKVAYTQRNIIL